MEADDPRLADEYVNEFVLDHLDVTTTTVKREIQTSDYNHHQQQDHQQHQHQDHHPGHHPHHIQLLHHGGGGVRLANVGVPLPSMPITNAGNGSAAAVAAAAAAAAAAATLVHSPPPHFLLTPPGCEQEYHHPSRHHHPQMQVNGNGMLIHGHGAAAEAGGVLISGIASAVKVSGATSEGATGSMMYPSTPGTPPDTPPVSSSPPPATPIRQPGYMDEMIWLTQSLRQGQEPLDLRPNYAGSDDMQQHHHHHHHLQNQHQQHHNHHHHHQQHQQPGSAVEWNMAQHQHVTVIQPSNSNGGKVPSGFGHQHANNDDMSPSPDGSGCLILVDHMDGSSHRQQRAMSVSSNSIMSPLSSRCGGRSAEDLINDALLLQLPVRDLNKRLQGISKEEVARLKQKRRTLKNRGYAQSCRTKRMNQRIELENANHHLASELQKMKAELVRVAQERDLYKQRCSALANARESMAAAAVAAAAAGSRGGGGDSNSNSPELYL